MTDRFWTVKSKWDHFAFIALIQWLAVGVASSFWAGAWAAGSLRIEPLALALGAVAVTAFGAIFVFNFLALLTVLASAFGSRRHEHIPPGLLYHLTAIFFGPIAGIHYLYRTGVEA